MRAAASLAAVVLAVSLSACGSDDSTSATVSEPTVTVTAEPSPTLTPTPSPTPTEAAVAPVSNSTTCHVIMASPSIPKSNLSMIVNFINEPNSTASSLRRAVSNFEDVKVATESAKGPLRDQLEAYVAALQPYFDRLESGRSATLRTTAFKTAGFEIVRICTPYLT